MRVEDGFGVVRAADCPGFVKLDQFAGDLLRFGKLLRVKLLRCWGSSTLRQLSNSNHHYLP